MSNIGKCYFCFFSASISSRAAGESSSSFSSAAKQDNNLKRVLVQTMGLKKQVQGMKTQRTEDRKIIDEQRQKLVHQSQTISELSSQVAAQDLKIVDLERRFSEFSRQLTEKLETEPERKGDRRRRATDSVEEVAATTSSGTSHKPKRSRRK